MSKYLNKTNLARTIAITTLFSLGLALTACIPFSDQTQNNSPQQANNQRAPSGKDADNIAEQSAKFGSDAKPGHFPREVTHAMGSTTITSEPKRVVVLETGELDSVLAMGLKPVGITTTKGSEPVPSYLADRVKDVATVGTVNEINVEKIAELHPDLILGTQLRAEKLYPQLSAIAPTVFDIRPGFTWKENFLLAGAALGREDKAKEVLAHYDHAATNIKERIEPGTKVTMVRFLPDKLRLYAHKSLIGTVLCDAGFARPKSQDVDQLATEISPEEIDKADADYIFYSSYGDPDATGENKIVSSSAWQNLQATKKGHVHRVDDGLWGLGLGPVGATKIIELLGDFIKH